MKKRNGRKTVVSLLTTLWLGLTLLVGLMAQTRQAEAQTNPASPAEYKGWEWPWGAKPKPPSDKDIAAAIKACLAEVKAGTISRDDLPACFLKKIGKKTWDANCTEVAKAASPQWFEHGDPCVAAAANPPLYERACSDCAEVNYFCCILKSGLGAAAKCKTAQTREEMRCN